MAAVVCSHHSPEWKLIFAPVLIFLALIGDLSQLIMKTDVLRSQLVVFLCRGFVCEA